MTGTSSHQVSIRCVLMRGGTSNGLYLHEKDLPAPGPARDALLTRLMGSPDVLQIDGLGGSRPITSKIAIIAPSSRSDADVDYTFAQVEVDRDAIHYTANCGNISAGVGPFAIDEGLVEVTDGHTAVRIYNTNTAKILIAHVPVADGRAEVEGDLAIAGVPGTGAEIVMDWAATIGAKTGSLLPTGNVRDKLLLETGAVVEATLCDAGNPCVWIQAAALGLNGSELSDDINADDELIDAVREVRGKAAVLLGFCSDWRRVDEDSPGLPMVGLIAPPGDYHSLNGKHIPSADMDLRVRLIFMNRLHESIAGAGAVCITAASRVVNSVVCDVAQVRTDGELRIGHPSGVMPTVVATQATELPPFVSFERLGISRTARRLMDGNAYLPKSVVTEQRRA